MDAGMGPPRVTMLPHLWERFQLDIKSFSTLTSLGVPYDITLHELRVECFFPADTATETTLRDLARTGARGVGIHGN